MEFENQLTLLELKIKMIKEGKEELYKDLSKESKLKWIDEVQNNIYAYEQRFLYSDTTNHTEWE
jgi:hypothetical protein